MNRQQRAARPVTVFGAGIAGLTAAHELVTRGFKVQVIDPEYNEEFHPASLQDRQRSRPEDFVTLDRGIGGMARSQFAMLPGGGLGDAQMERLWQGEELLVDQAIAFESTPDADGCAVPLDVARAERLLDKLADARAALALAKKPVATIRIRVPTSTPDPAGQPRATQPPVEAKKAYLKRALAARGIDSLDHVVEWSHPLPENGAYFAVLARPVPAEHGFRFFPSFYRHLFDTMRRTRILAPQESERTKATVFENLVPTDGLGFARSGTSHAFMVPRRAMMSFEAVRKLLGKFLEELEYTLEDIARFQLKLFKYMTSGTARRQREYEHMSWGTFVESEKYSPVSREHIEYGPQMSAALRGSQSDARTQGNITIQLLLDQLKPDAHADYLLAGPTSGAWLDHWHDFLADQDVEFKRGELTGFEVTGPQDKLVVEPVVTPATAAPTGQFFVIALSLPAMVETQLAAKLIDAARLAGRPVAELQDLERTLSFAGDLEADLQLPCPDGPLQHLSGIQYYFDQEVRFWRGHTQYLDSAWGLTSIAQPQFWSRARVANDGYLSILSVDIGIFDRAFEGKTAWECTSDEIAARAWQQIRDHHDDAFKRKYGKTAVFPTPTAYALDAKLAFTEPGDRTAEPAGRTADRMQWTTKKNLSPFLVNRTSKFPTRPGKLERCGDSKSVASYDVIADRFVLAGTFMQTFTRLTSMEAANESARHAVNALFQHWNIGGDRCEIWDPEDHELEDLQWFKDLDDKLVSDKLPHFVDILGWSELPAQLSPDHLRAFKYLRGRSVR